MRYLMFFLAALVAGPVLADSCSRSARINNKLVVVGDSIRRVDELGPDREWRLENRYGGSAGIRMDFYQRGKTVQVYIKAGKVSKICHLRD
ncbi:MAG TPA: hypothetical protein VK036_02640 [Wenzhouxiangella sp.]|nr:hypothetical protein [Wenzhouxiangella sp.]